MCSDINGRRNSNESQKRTVSTNLSRRKCMVLLFGSWPTLTRIPKKRGVSYINNLWGRVTDYWDRKQSRYKNNSSGKQVLGLKTWVCSQCNPKCQIKHTHQQERRKRTTSQILGLSLRNASFLALSSLVLWVVLLPCKLRSMREKSLGMFHLPKVNK